MKINSMRTITGVSAANTEKTHTIAVTKLGVIRDCYLHSMTVSTKGADPASDIDIAIKDNGVEVWGVTLRAEQIFGGHFRWDGYPIVIRDGDCTIVTSAAGASCVVKVSAVYSIT